MLRRAILLWLAASLVWRASGWQEERTPDVLLGAELGLDPSHEMDAATLDAVIQGASRGDPDALYSLGLFRLYGIGMVADASSALKNFRCVKRMLTFDAEEALEIMLLIYFFVFSLFLWGDPANPKKSGSEWTHVCAVCAWRAAFLRSEAEARSSCRQVCCPEDIVAITIEVVLLTKHLALAELGWSSQPRKGTWIRTS
eukprot:scaffold7028_cov243-Pinguiococcus_pyrenoidosus.AAC.16